MAAQVAHFRSDSTSPLAPSTSKPGAARNKNNMTSAGQSTINGATNAGQSNNFEGITALMLACQQGRLEDVQKILAKKKTVVKERTRTGKVALHFCAEAGSTACFDQILAAEPFLINTQDEEGYTPLHLAVINGSKDIVRKLIASGADLNCLDNERHSLVHWATVCGEVDILEVLLSSGAPASTPDIHLAHPIHYAAQMCGSVNGVAASRARVQSTVYGVSPKKGLQILKRLVQFGCPVDVRDQDGRQPLLWASSAGSGDAILLLVNAGAKVDAEDKDGLTALHCAASRGHTDCLETLIALCGAEVDVIDNNGCTALFYAVTLGHADCTELLLNYGSEPNRQDRKGRTPGHCGAAKGQLETLKLLVKHGGNLWLRNVRGDLPLHEAVLSRRKDLVMWLLSLRPDAVNTSNNDGRCPIHLAALNNNVEMVKILIDHRAEINVLMRSGKGTAMTPLDAAIMRGNSAVAKFLQLHGGLPSNSLNDAALHRRLNRSSVEGQISPASSMRGSNLGSHHHPSPEDQQMNFTSPEVFDSSLIHYSRNSQNHNVYDKRGPQATSPFIPTSTPIMDDGVQTDPHYFRDMEVQTTREHVEKGDESQDSKPRNNSHRKSDRRRRQRSRQDDQEGSSESSADRSSNQLGSRASRKSSRKSGKGSSVNSGSKSNSSSRNSEDKVKGQDKDSIDKDDETDSRSHSRNKKKGFIPQQSSSDTLLDNTMMSEKFSELENVAAQSSETDAREEELGPPEKIEQSTQRKQKSESNEKVQSKSIPHDETVEGQSGEEHSKVSKRKTKDRGDDEKRTDYTDSKSGNTKSSSKSRSKPKQESRESSPEKSAKAKEISVGRDRVKTFKSKERQTGKPDSVNKSTDQDQSKSKSKDRSLSAKSTGRKSVCEERKSASRSRSASASRAGSASSRHKNDEVVVSDDNIKAADDQDMESKGERSSARKSRSQSLSPKRPSSKKNSNLKSRTPSGKTGSVSWHDETEKPVEAKESSSNELHSALKSQESKEEEMNSEVKKSRSLSQESNTEEKSGRRSRSSGKSSKRTEAGEEKGSRSASAKSRRNQSKDFKEKDTPKSNSNTDDEPEDDIPDEIEAGKAINLREAARRRSESLARDPSRSRSQSVSKNRKPSKESTVGSSSQKKKSGLVKLKPIKSRKGISKSEEREIQLQEALLASRKNLRPKPSSIPKPKGYTSSIPKSGLKKIPTARQYSGEIDVIPDSGFSDPLGLTTSASEDHNNVLYSQGKSHASMKRKVVTRRPGSGSARRHTIFSSVPKQYRAPGIDRKRFDPLIVSQLGVANGPDGDDSTSTRGGSVTSEETVENISRRRKPNLNRPRSRLTFSRGDDVRDARQSPRARKNMDVDTPISVTQAMQASMRKYNLERTVFQELLELKRLQIRAGKANEQMLVKRLAENYRKAGYSVNFRDYDGPYTFRGFEKFLYDQLRVLQSNKRVLPRFAPSDDLEKLSTALKKMNATKLPFLEEAERSESTTCDSQCAHSTHRCHHAAHAYTGVPCAAYIGNRKNGFLPKVNPLKAPGPTQKDAGTRNMMTNGSRNGMNGMNLSSPMQISISPRTDTQSPITLEVQQGSNTQVFTLPTKALDPFKNYYVSLSIKPNPTSRGDSPVPAFKPLERLDDRPSPAGDLADDGSISAPPPPAETDSDVQLEIDREKHNRST